MKKGFILAFTAALLLVLPFFIHPSLPRSIPSFDYFLDNLMFIEKTLTSMAWQEKLKGYPIGDFTLESVADDLGLRNHYLAHFESDLGKAQLSGDASYIAFAFQDRSKNPIRIWIDDESYRVYSTGHDGISKTGGLDADDIWTGDPEKARAYVHKAYDDWRREQYEKNLWEQLFERIKAR